jgi:hypothetical protein
MASGRWRADHLQPGAYPEARVSLIVFFVSLVYLVASGAVSAPLTVRDWTVKDLPSSREVTSQWDGG